MIPSVTSSDAGSGDESLTWDPAVREAVLDLNRLASWQARSDRLLEAEGAGHLVHDLPLRADGRGVGIESRPWRIDPIPLVLNAGTFQWLAAAIEARMDALELVVDDLYGAQVVVRERIVHGDALFGTPAFRPVAIGSPPPKRWITTYAIDLMRTVDGAWEVVQDLTDAPPGLGYALLNRSVTSRVVPELMFESGVASLARYPARLGAALAAASDAVSPRTVLFSGGIDHPSYVDHSYLAVQLGVHLAEGPDLVVRQGSVWLRTLDALEPIDVIYRRLEDPGVDPLEVGALGSAGVPGLLRAVRSGSVSLANGHGVGVLEAPHLGDAIDQAMERLTGETPLLPRRRPDSVPARSPSFGPSGVSTVSSVVRMFAVRDDERVWVLPGGTGRILHPGDDPRTPTPCAAKDVWVLGISIARPVQVKLPQVDFSRSVPTRAADSLYWMNRAAERAEVMVRTTRVISARLEQDPSLGSLAGGAWSARMRLVSLGVRRDRVDDPTVELALSINPSRLRTELAENADRVAAEIGSLLTEATSVREYLSVTTGRVLEHLARLRGDLQRHVAAVDDFDAILADFAALAGLWNESTVRGPAWRLGDVGRRLERALAILDLVESAVLPAGSGVEFVDELAIEVLLAANESLVTYRRRHRSDVELEAALDLILRDAENPRSLAACLDRLERHASAADWDVGVTLVFEAQRALSLPTDELVPTIRSIMYRAGNELVKRWFSAPVNPIALMHR